VNNITKGRTVKNNAPIYSAVKQEYQNIDKETTDGCIERNVLTSDCTATQKMDGGEVKRSY
jgi:hypothetical protein